MSDSLYSSDLKSLPLRHRGKVRDIYDVDDRHMLIVTTDRLSAFDVVLPTPIPDKGRMLTRLSNFWFARTRHIVPNHLSAMTLAKAVPDARERAPLEGRVWWCALQALPVEAIVRGYLAGSGWKDYQRTGTVCGIALPAGLEQADRLPEPIFTPSTKAAAGAHDENIDFAAAERLLGKDVAAQVRDISLALYRFAAELRPGARHHHRRHQVRVRPRRAGRADLIDEVLTPDSSRFWPADEYRPGISPPSFDKQYVRDYLETLDWNKTAPGPELPAEIAAAHRAEVPRGAGAADGVFYEIAALLVLAAGSACWPAAAPAADRELHRGRHRRRAGGARHRPLQRHIELLAELGIAILLFLVGLKLDLHLVRTLGPVALATGLGQVAFTSVIGFSSASRWACRRSPSLYVAVALTFSSTIIIVKLLSDKREIDSLHGRIAVGFLIVQDLVVIVAMIVLSAVGVRAARGPGGTRPDRRRLGAACWLAVGRLFMRFVAPPLVRAAGALPGAAGGVRDRLGGAAGRGRRLGWARSSAGCWPASRWPRRRSARRSRRASPRCATSCCCSSSSPRRRLELSVLGEQALAASVLSLFVLIGNPLIVI
jgi:phosphoribosylaminoimidazole-succinocarboxamide synthase